MVLEMVQLVSFNASDALEDAIRLKRECDNQLDDQIDELKTLLNGGTLDPDYHHCLLFLLTKMEKFKLPKRRSVCSNVVNEGEDCDGESDPQYGLFLSGLKKHENSYVLEGVINDLPTFIKYEGESSLKNASERNRGRKTRSGVERIKMLSNKNPGLPNDQDPVNQPTSDMQVQSGNKSSEQSPRKLANLVKRKNSNEEANRLSNQKTDLRNNRLSTNQHGDDMQAPSNRMNDVVSLKQLENTIVVHASNGVTENQNGLHEQAQMGKKDEVMIRGNLRKSVETDNMVKRVCFANSESAPNAVSFKKLKNTTVVQANNWVTVNQNEPRDQAQMGKKHEVQIQKNLRKSIETKKIVKRARFADTEFALNVGSLKKLKNTTVVQANNGVTENQNEPRVQAEMGKKHEVQIQKNLRKSIETEKVVKRVHFANSESALAIGHLNQMPSPMNDLVRGNPIKQVDQAQPTEREHGTVQRQARKVANAKNVIEGEYEASQIAEINIENEHLCQNPGPRRNLVTKCQYESIDQTIPGNSKCKVQMKMKGYEASRDSVIQHQKPGLKKGQVTEYQCDDVDQAPLVKKDMVRSQRTLRIVVEGKNEVRVENEFNKKDGVWIDIEHVHHNPCTRNNWVEAENQEENWVEAENGLSNPKIAFGDNSAAKEGKTQAQRGNEGIHLKVNQVKEDEDESDPDIEILDKDTFYNNTGNMRNKDDALHLKTLCLCGEFRRQVMNALKRPFDQQEYTWYQDAVKAGSYFNSHPDLEQNLKKCRYEKGKRLAILRGFFFWLEHLTQAGSFKPWTDEECLAVDSKAF